MLWSGREESSRLYTGEGTSIRGQAGGACRLTLPTHPAASSRQARGARLLSERNQVHQHDDYRSRRRWPGPGRRASLALSSVGECALVATSGQCAHDRLVPHRAGPTHDICRDTEYPRWMAPGHVVYRHAALGAVVVRLALCWPRPYHRFDARQQSARRHLVGPPCAAPRVAPGTGSLGLCSRYKRG